MDQDLHRTEEGQSRPKRVRRPRALQACERCRLKKNKCDECFPCSHCVRHSAECVYRNPDVSRKMNPEHSLLQRADSSQIDSARQSSPLAKRYDGSLDVQPPTETDRSHFPSPIYNVDSNYRERAQQDTNSEFRDEELRPSTAEDVTDVNQYTKSIEFHGSSSSVAFLQQIQMQQSDPMSPLHLTRAPSLVSMLHNTDFRPVGAIPQTPSLSLSTSDSASTASTGTGCLSSVTTTSSYLSDVSSATTLNGSPATSSFQQRQSQHSNQNAPTAETLSKHAHVFYFRQASRFLDTYFDSIHFLQPFLDKEEFLLQCEDLWFGRAHKQSLSFWALYFAIMSLGALLGQWDDDSDGGTRKRKRDTNIETELGSNAQTRDEALEEDAQQKLFEDKRSRFWWSRRLFDEARGILARLGTTTNLEMVQCLLIMGKICQHELNPHIAYMYIGMAVRTALAIGLNRQPTARYHKEDISYSRAAWKTWWVLYSLENMTSFALGRPDTLGDDRYHNRQYRSSTTNKPASSSHLPSEVRNTELAIIPCMVDYSRIIKKVCLDVYLTSAPPREKLLEARRIEVELDEWLDRWLDKLGTDDRECSSRSLKAARGWKYAKKQQLIVKIRYHNVRMLLYGSFLTPNQGFNETRSALFSEGIEKCVLSAIQTIEIIHDTYSHDNYFQTWWYNITYTLFAVTILLIYIFRSQARSTEGSDRAASPGHANDSAHLNGRSGKPTARSSRLLEVVEMAVEILEVMDECLVAKNAGEIIKRTLARAKESHYSNINDSSQLSPNARRRASRSRTSRNRDSRREVDINSSIEFAKSTLSLVQAPDILSTSPGDVALDQSISASASDGHIAEVDAMRLFNPFNPFSDSIDGLGGLDLMHDGGSDIPGGTSIEIDGQPDCLYTAEEPCNQHMDGKLDVSGFPSPGDTIRPSYTETSLPPSFTSKTGVHGSFWTEWGNSLENLGM